MTKKLLIIGTLGQGLDVETSADTSAIETLHLRGRDSWFPEYIPQGWEVHKLVSSKLSFAEIQAELAWLAGADIARIYYTGHGFNVKENGKKYVGYYLNKDNAFTADFFVDNFVNKIKAKEVSLILDMCFAGATKNQLMIKGVNGKLRSNIKTKGITLNSQDIFIKSKEEGKIKLKKRVSVMCSSIAKNSSYGKFNGGKDDSWLTLNTRGNSWFTFNLIAAFNFWAQTSSGYTEYKRGLKFILNQTQHLDKMLKKAIPYKSELNPQCPTGNNLKKATVL